MSRLRVGTPVEAAGVTLIPVERVHSRGARLGPGFWVSAEIEPVAVVVCDAAGARALDSVGNAWAIDELVDRLPELRARLERLTSP